MDGLGADNSKEVCCKKWKEEVVCRSAGCRHPLLSLHWHKHLGLKEVGDSDGGVGEDDGKAWPEEAVHEDRVEGGEGHEGGNHGGDASQGKVGSPSDHPSRSFHFVFLCVFVKSSAVVIIVVVSVASLLDVKWFCPQLGNQTREERVSDVGQEGDVGGQ